MLLQPNETGRTHDDAARGEGALLRGWRERWGAWGLLALYALIVCVMTAYHEPFMDEADVWLAARDLSIGQLLRFTAYVGNPAGWYLILMAPAKLGAPYESMQWIHAAIAIGAGGVVLFRAPFPLLTRGLFVFSFYMGYQYSAVARNYALLALVLFLTAEVYRRRWDRPLLFALLVVLLAETTTHATFLAASIFATFCLQILAERRLRPRYLLAAGMMFAGLLAVAAQLWPPADAQMPHALEMRFPGAIIETLARVIVIPFGSPLLHPLWVSFNLVILAFAILYLVRRPWALLLLAMGSAGLFYIFVFKWSIPVRHAGLLLLWLMFCLWIGRYEPESDWLSKRLRWRVNMPLPSVARALNIGLFAACITAAVAWDEEIRIEYSHARQMAQLIRSQNWDLTEPIAATYVANGLLPYLRCRQFWNVNTRQYVSHNTWTREYHNNALLRESHVWERLPQFPGARRPLLVWDAPLFNARLNGYRLLYQTQGPVGTSGERFYLYGPEPGDQKAATTRGSE